MKSYFISSFIGRKKELSLLGGLCYFLLEGVGEKLKGEIRCDAVVAKGIEMDTKTLLCFIRSSSGISYVISLRNLGKPGKGKLHYRKLDPSEKKVNKVDISDEFVQKVLSLYARCFEDTEAPIHSLLTCKMDEIEKSLNQISST
jgi:hypothetical protein